MVNNVTQKDNLREVLNHVSDRVSSSESRSLWEKMREEMQLGGPDAAAKYLAAELDRCKQNFESELTLLREKYSRRQRHE